MVSNKALVAGAGLVLVTFVYGGLARAADVGPGQLPAVSEINGKLQFDGGWAALNGFNNSTEFEGGASLSLPLGQAFGLQADFGASNSFGDSRAGGAAHLFTRDPNSYLLGMMGGALWTQNANAQFVGPEAEFYAGPLVFQVAGGYMNLNLASVNSAQFYGFGDVSYFPMEDLRLNLGASDMASFKMAHVGLEYQFSDALPVSLNLVGKLGDNGYVGVDAGLTIYFGGPAKSLMRRQREDDPPNRILDIFGAAGNAFVPPSPPAKKCTPYPECVYF